MHEMWRDAKERCPFPARLAHPSYIQMLKVSDATMDDLQGLSGGCSAEVPALDQCDGEPTLSGVPSRRSPADASSNNHDIEFHIGERRKISRHRRTQDRRYCSTEWIP